MMVILIPNMIINGNVVVVKVLIFVGAQKSSIMATLSII